VFGARPLADRAEIRRDRFGVPHILAEDEEAAAFAFGYAMAEDHAAEIGRRYLQARGDSARHFGDAELDSDLAMRRFDNLATARRAYDEDTGRRFRRWLRGFAAGINEYVAAHRDAVPAWMPVVQPWDPLAFSRMFGALGAGRPPARLLEKYPGGAATAARATVVEPAGSNALAVAGSRSTSGSPILLGNPHLGWSNLYWEAHVTVPGRFNFYGSTLVGIPVLRAGFNDRLGYVQTNNAPDVEDIYSFPADHPIDRREVAVEVRREDGTLGVERRHYEETDDGPVIYRTAERLFVLRSMDLEWPRQFEGFFELMSSRSLREFRATLARRLAATSNYTYADVDGNILYTWQARLPRRRDTSADYDLDMPGNDKDLAWRGVHRAAELPFLLNPRSGYVQNANNPPWWTSLADPLDPADYPSYIERGQLSLRAQVALDALERTPRWSTDMVRELKFDTRMRVADLLLPELLAAARRVAAPSEALRAGIDTLEQWDHRADADSRGAVLFERFLNAYDARYPARFAVPWDPAAPMATPRGLIDGDAAVTALERSVGDVRAEHGSERVAWGDVHRYRIGALDLPGDGASGRQGVFRVVTFDAGGDGRLVAGNTGGGRPLSGFGDAWVLLVHFTRPVSAWSVLAYGQTTNLDSPHSRDQIELFARHQLRPVWFSEESIAANTARRYRPAASVCTGGCSSSSSPSPSSSR
jgi:acyl-homoserine-lactone acylase